MSSTAEHLEKDAEMANTEKRLSVVPIEKFDDVRFDFDAFARRFVSSENSGIEPTRESRLRGVLDALRATCSDTLDVPSNLAELKRINKYLAHNISVGGRNGKRHEFGDIEAVQDQIFQELEHENHPLYQALTQLRDWPQAEAISNIDLALLAEDSVRLIFSSEVRAGIERNVSLERDNASPTRYIPKT